MEAFNEQFGSNVFKAVDVHQDLLRVSVASAGNDHRLGANEAPPAIISTFLGDELVSILDSIEAHTAYTEKGKKKMEIGVGFLPHFFKDTTDRNRTSPFAFTGNKFEFRMPGSSFSVAGINVVLNTIVADALCDFADALESSKDFTLDAMKLVAETYTAHKRIVFNGDNYSASWVDEASKRGLLNLLSTPDALPYFKTPENVALFEKFKVFSKVEVESRFEILLENYCKTLHIEALSMIDMIKRSVVPSVFSYETELAKLAKTKEALGVSAKIEKQEIEKLDGLLSSLLAKLNTFEFDLLTTKTFSDLLSEAKYYKERIFVGMQEMRILCDQLETIVPRRLWAFPSYGEILYSVM